MFITHINRILGGPYFDATGDDTGGNDKLGDLDVLGDEDKSDDSTDDDGKSDEEDVVPDDTGDESDDEDTSDKDGDQEDTDDEETDDETDDDAEEENDTEEDQIPSVKELKKDYPDLFKKHPEVKAAIFRDQKYAELIGSVEDAERAAVAVTTLGSIETDLLVNTDATKLLSTIKKSDEKAYEKLVLGLLPRLAEADKEIYYKVATLPIKQLLRNAWREGEGDKTNLGKAAAWIHEYMFGKGAKFEDKVESEIESKSEKTAAQKEYEEKLEEINKREYTAFKSAVDESYGKRMESFIRETLDKDERLTEFTRKNIVRETLEEILGQLQQDTRYNSTLDSLWRQAKAAGFNKDFKGRILNTALLRAKSLAPKIRARLLNEALGKSSSKKKVVDLKEGKKKIVQPQNNRSRQDGNKSQNDKGKFKSDIDILRES